MVDSRAMRERRHLNQGFGRSLSNAMEIALVPAILAFAGFGLDRLIGTRFVLATLFGLLGIVGTGVKLYYAYVHEMAQHERDGAWNRTPAEGAE